MSSLSEDDSFFLARYMFELRGTAQTSNRPKWENATLFPGCFSSSSRMVPELHCGAHTGSEQTEEGQPHLCVTKLDSF